MIIVVFVGDGGGGQTNYSTQPSQYNNSNMKQPVFQYEEVRQLHNAREIKQTKTTSLFPDQNNTLNKQEFIVLWWIKYFCEISRLYII